MSTHVVSLDEGMWGSLLVPITMAIRGTGMFGILRIIDLLKERVAPMESFLLNYTTLQAGYLPQHWHLLEALLGMAGLLTVAWPTGILYMLAQDFQDTQLHKRRRRREQQGEMTCKSERDASADSRRGWLGAARGKLCRHHESRSGASLWIADAPWGTRVHPIDRCSLRRLAGALPGS